MSAAMGITDDEIIAAVKDWGNSNMTYVVTNKLRMSGYKGLKTPYILRRLKALEGQGKVKRIKSPYAVQICWAVVMLEAKP